MMRTWRNEVIVMLTICNTGVIFNKNIVKISKMNYLTFFLLKINTKNNFAIAD